MPHDPLLAASIRTCSCQASSPWAAPLSPAIKASLQLEVVSRYQSELTAVHTHTFCVVCIPELQEQAGWPGLALCLQGKHELSQHAHTRSDFLEQNQVIIQVAHFGENLWVCGSPLSVSLFSPQGRHSYPYNSLFLSLGFWVSEHSSAVVFFRWNSKRNTVLSDGSDTEEEDGQIF